MTALVLGGHNIVSCPYKSSTLFNGSLHNPTTTILYFVSALIALLFALITIWCYNSVRVFNRKIRTANISNNNWIVYFVFFASQYQIRIICRNALLSLKYAFNTEEQEGTQVVLLNSILIVLSFLLNGIAVLFFELALNHQKKYRSSAFPTSSPVAQNDSSVSPSAIRRSFGFLPLYVFLCIIYGIALFFCS